MNTTPLDRRWFAPRERIPVVGERWSDWARWLRFASGAGARAIQRDAQTVVEISERLRAETDIGLTRALRQHAQTLIKATRRGQAAPRDVFLNALAHVAEAAGRTVGMRPYPVQVQAAIGMLDGCAVQMNAGEGKTLSVALASSMHGLAGRHCHVVTANDYLAGRDVELMRPLYTLCGLSAAALVPQSEPDVRSAAYACDLVYGTGKELLADFLRDRLAGGGGGDERLRLIAALRGRGKGEATVMRGLDAAIVDEADSVLIDEATTPLIISAGEGNEMLLQAVSTARQLVDALEAGRDYTIDQRFRDVRFTEAGKSRMAEMTQHLDGLWRSEGRRHDLLSQAVVARDLFEENRHFIVQDGEVVIVDENTGRTMPGRSWSYGLHQAIEARVGVEMTEPARTMARMSFQDFYARYRHLSGASGTLQGVQFELWRTYGLVTLVVPPRLPSRLQVPAHRHFAGAKAKRDAIIQTVIELHDERRAVLVGTRRIDDSEDIAQALAERGIDCAVLNARQHEHEAKVIAAAGQAGRVTVATNMAGRGTDILLNEEVLRRGGLHVLMLEPHESARVDWQLFGRAGRQGSPGWAQPFASLEDDLIKRHVPWWARPLRLLARTPLARAALMGSLIKLSQWRAQRLAWAQRRLMRSQEKKLGDQLSFTHDPGRAGGGQSSA